MDGGPLRPPGHDRRDPSPGGRPPKRWPPPVGPCGCDPLASYLRAITAPMTLSRFVGNIGDSLGFTTMSFSADPHVPRSSSVARTPPVGPSRSVPSR